MRNRMHLAALAVGLSLTFASGAQAACNAIVNGRPMSMELCQAAYLVYGGVVPGRYQMDQTGNWVNLDNPAHAGNIFRDAQMGRGGGGGRGGGSGGLTTTPFGNVGDGYYFDPESGASVGP